MFVLPRQVPEQHCPPLLHEAPEVRQHVPAPPSVTEQVVAVPQHCAGVPQGPPSVEQQVCVVVLQLFEQQSWPISHRSPSDEQRHLPVDVSQSPLQQSDGCVQLKNARVQHEPWRHASKPQHSDAPGVQLDPGGLQHEPSHRSPSQQGDDVPQPWRSPTQHCPPELHAPEQHWLPPSQPAPLFSQHAPDGQRPEQQSVSLPHVVPVA